MKNREEKKIAVIDLHPVEMEKKKERIRNKKQEK